MNEGRHPDLDRDRSMRRSGSGKSATSGGPSRLKGGMGCSLLSLGAVIVIIGMAATGLLQQTATLLKGELGGGAAAKMELRMINNGRQLLAAMKLYAADHNSNFPDSLYDLAPDPLTDVELDRLLTEGAEGSEGGVAWILTPDLSHSPPNTDILILSSTPLGNGKYVAALGDGSVTSISSEEAAEHLAHIGK